MDAKSINRFKSYCDSLEALRKALDRDLSDDFVLSGTVMKYSLTFDIVWKVMKDLAIQYFKVGDFATGSPRETLRVAASVMLIDDDAWMDMLNLRNDLAHDYDGKKAEESIDLILGIYLSLFDKFKGKAKEYYEMDE